MSFTPHPQSGSNPDPAAAAATAVYPSQSHWGTSGPTDNLTPYAQFGYDYPTHGAFGPSYSAPEFHAPPHASGNAGFDHAGPYDLAGSIATGFHAPPPRPNSTHKWLIGVIVAVGAVIMVGSALMFIAPTIIAMKWTSDTATMISEISGAATDQILEENLDVELGAATIDPSKYSKRVNMPVTLHNKGDKRASFSVAVEAVNESGERLADTVAYVTDLAPDQTFRDTLTFYVDTDEKLAQMKSATYSITTVSMT